MAITRTRPVAEKRGKHTSTRWSRGTPRLVMWLGIAMLGIVVGYPLLWLLLTAFGLPIALSPAAVAKVFGDSANLVPIRNTLLLAVGSAVFSVLLGTPLAWATARTNVPGRGFVHVMVAVAFITPPYLIAIAYIILLGPEEGHFNQLLVLAGVGPLNIFSLGGVIAVVSFHGIAYTYFLTYDALRNIDAPLEEAASILGARTRVITWRITLPLAAPAIAGGALLSGVQAMADFGPQAFLGTPGQVIFLPTRIYGALGSYPPRFAESAVMSLILVAFTVLGLYVQRRFLQGRSFVTIGGRGVRVERLRLGFWRLPAMAGCVVVVFFSTVAPLGVLLTAALSKSWTQPPTFDNLTLANFATALFEDQVAARGVLNSLLLAAGAATVATVLGLVVSYFNHRTRYRGRRLLDYLAALPLGLPGTVLAFGLILAFIRPPFQMLYGTMAIIFVAYIGRFVPLAVRATDGGLAQVDSVLEDAARITGASWLTTACRVLVPVLWPSLLTAWLLVFIPALSELSATILLYTSGGETISVAIFRLRDLGQFEPVAALSVFAIAVALGAAALVRLLSRRTGASS